MFLLCELPADEALPDVLRFLAQDNDGREFWLGDYVTEFLKDLMARFARPQNYQHLFEFATNRKNYEYVCDAIYGAVGIQAMLQPELKETSEHWLERVIETLGKDARPGQIDDHLSLAVNAIVDVNATNLLPLAKKYHDLEVIDESISGDFEDFVGYMGSRDEQLDYIDLESGCAYINNFCWKPTPPFHYPDNAWLGRIMAHYTNMQAVTKATDEEPDEENEDSPKNTETFEKQTRTTAPSLNSPCPCGSGKKYKRCCGQ